MNILDRALDFWTPEPLLDCQTVFLLGNGPSLCAEDVDRLWGRQVMALNSACSLAPWAPFLWFMDGGWFDAHQSEVEAWRGLVITTNRDAKRALPDKIHRVNAQPHVEFQVGASTIKWGRSSGHMAISLAVAMGAIRVVLLGYDMRRVDNQSHWHSEYGTTDDALFAEFRQHFKGWREAARRCGVQIVNCTPGSALKEFQMSTLDAELAA